MTFKRVPSFHGSYEIFQNARFAKIFASESGLKVHFENDLVFLFKQYPLLGFMNGMVCNPEMETSFRQWKGGVDNIDFAYLKLMSSENPAEFRPFCVSQPDNCNMLLDLTKGESGLFDGFTRQCRKTVRAGKKRGLIVREPEDEKEFLDFYQILQLTSDNGSRFQVWNLDLLKALMREDFAGSMVVVSGGRVIGGIFYLLCNSNIFAWYSAVNPDDLHLKAGNLLISELARWGTLNGFRYLDLGQQGLRQYPGITKFKMSFNPVLAPAYIYNITGSLLKRRLMDVKNRLL